MDDLAHWIINISTGAMIGISIYCAGSLFIRLTEAMPNRIPLLTPAWYAIRRPIERLIAKLPR